MKPTQEQIEAALQWADTVSTYAPTSALPVLAAAYREKCEECEKLKKELRHLADLLDAHFENGGTIAGLGTTNKARKLLEPTP
jgi:hypothetical protein